MKLLSYKAFGPGATIIDNLIGIFTFSRYSHTELQFSSGECFSISGRDGGARFKHINVSTKNWDTQQLPDMDEDLIYESCLQYNQKEYDYLGAFFSALRVCIHRKDKVFCSEVCANVLSENGFDLRKGCTYTPQALHNEIHKYEKDIYEN